MRTDFSDAARRHFADGDHLFARNRFANADHLYGLAAECGLKAIMVGLKPNLKCSTRGIIKSYQVHIDKLWNQFLALATGRLGAKYSAHLDPANPFSNWTVDQRYSHSTCVNSSIVINHQKAVESIKKALQDAQNDGIL